jgi:hypothetical protein
MLKKAKTSLPRLIAQDYPRFVTAVPSVSVVKRRVAGVIVTSSQSSHHEKYDIQLVPVWYIRLIKLNDIWL